MVPSVAVHEHNENGEAMIYPLEDGTRGDAGGDVSINGGRYASVHLTSGYKAGAEVLVPSECIEEVQP